MIRALHRRAEKRHDLIADELVQGAVVQKDRLRGDIVEAVQLSGHISGLKLFGERGKTADVDE